MNSNVYGRKRMLSAVLAMMMGAAALLSGCGASAAGTSSGSGSDAQTGGLAPAPAAQTASEPAAGSPVEIEFWYSLGGANGELIEAMTADFNASQDQVFVRPAYQGDYYTNHSKVLAAVAAGNQPDVTIIEVASVGAFADAGVIEPLSPYTQGAEKDYIDGLMGNSYWKDELYAIPFNRSTPLLYVNKALLKEAGLNPEGPKTWAELEEFAGKLTKQEGGKTVRYGFSTPIDIWFYEALVFQSGGSILTEDNKQLALLNEAGKAPLEFWSRMIKEGIMKNPPGEKYNAWDVAKQDFVNGQVAMIFTSTGDLKGLKETAGFEVGTAFLPANKDYGAPTGGANLAVLAASSPEKKQAAWKFIQWMTAPEQTIRWSQGSGYMPVSKTAVESDALKEAFAKDPNFKVAIDQLQYGKARPMVPGYKELQEVIMTEIQRVILGQATPDEALQAATDKANKLLRK
ncbi:glycerol-3-phosphate-binding periplasmic protein [Paenibacillus dendritiformis C454]|uniref:Glycerol-3-phosphate-binding periplasmic protein n=1 Tax=Paenibacillus dendritiformis C454 TaxID=1131935 RepID=H3SGC3_9BACL|nr:ABC transporter substrate-binding protein [Paenibacillus dendritiformis]EHQ61933.1 glycerol-3-phosphate-binding periplasmic protein [Paenibacillus dendritiformis C454]